MTAYVRILGETIPLAALVKHYRWCAREWPGSAGFWRKRLRVVIAAYRSQRVEREQEREAA